MLTKFRPGVIVAFGSVLALATSGVASAAPPVEKLSANKNYRLSLSIDYVDIQSVPNMAAAPLVREGFVTAKATFKVNCLIGRDKCDADEPEARLSTFVQVGCPMQLDGGITLGPQANLASGLPASLGGFLPEGGDVTKLDIAPTVSGLGPGVLEVKIKPGYIVDAAIGDKSVKLPKEKDGPAQAVAAASVTNRHIVVDQRPEGGAPPGPKEGHFPTCLGPTVVRIRAVGMLTTKRSSETMDIFSDLTTL